MTIRIAAIEVSHWHALNDAAYPAAQQAPDFAEVCYPFGGKHGSRAAEQRAANSGKSEAYAGLILRTLISAKGSSSSWFSWSAVSRLARILAEKRSDKGFLRTGRGDPAAKYSRRKSLEMDFASVPSVHPSPFGSDRAQRAGIVPDGAHGEASRSAGCRRSARAALRRRLFTHLRGRETKITDTRAGVCETGD
jgi:hypothetical protein